MATLTQHLDRLGAAQRAYSLPYVTEGNFIGDGTTVFGDDIVNATVGDSLGFSQHLRCYDRWPVMLEGKHVADLRDDGPYGYRLHGLGRVR